MDIFGRQDDSHLNSRWLLVAFTVAMVLTGLLVHIVVTAVMMLFGQVDSMTSFSGPSKAFIGIIWATCFTGCFFRFMDVRAGGPVLARRFGAVHASDRSRYREEKVLLDTVAEMAIASGCEHPDVYVLRHESSINAFVVGGFSGNEAIVVTQAALDMLSRDELQALVAHEFGHIAQGDIAINMRLLIALGGLNAIDEVGCLLTGTDPDRLWHPGVIVGFVFRGIGAVSVFFGRVIRAAFSRQREFLADACGVQYTRNPEAMASLLVKINELSDDEPLHCRHAGELAHLCFQNLRSPKWLKSLFATHPPLQKRIDAIDPHYDVKRRARERSDRKQERLVSMGVQAAMSRDMNVNLDGVTDKIALTLSDAPACLAALHAVFASDDPGKQAKYYKAIGFAYNKVFADQVEQIAATLDAEMHTAQLLIIEHATEKLRDSIKFDNRQRMLKSLEKLLVVEGEYTLMNYATLQLIRRQLDAEFPLLEVIDSKRNQVAEGLRSKSFDSMGQEFALLLSLVVEASGSPDSKLDDAFEQALACYTGERYPRRSGTEPDIVNELENAFQTLYVQPRAIRQNFVQHCVEIAQGDGHIARAEQALLDLFAASLKCDTVAA